VPLPPKDQVSSLSLSLSPKRGGPQKEWFIFNSVEPSIYELSKPD